MDQRQIVQELVTLLGLPKGLRSFTVRASVTGQVVVECEYYPQGDVAKEAGLVPPPPPPPPTRQVCDSKPPLRNP